MTRRTDSFTIAVAGPFDFELTVRKPAGWDWATPSEIYEDGVLYTALRLSESQLVGLKLRPDCGRRSAAKRALRGEEPSLVRVDVFSKPSDGAMDQAELDELQQMLQIGFAANDDLNRFYRLGEEDELIAQLVRDLYGMRPGFPTGVFERALLAICLQMAPLKRSIQMRACLLREYGETVDVDGKTITFWPSPARLAAAPTAQTAARCGLGYRARAIQRVADALSKGFPSIVELEGLSDEEVILTLKKLYGVGEYSAGIISPHRSFPLDVWSARIFHEILFGSSPPDPRQSIRTVTAEAEQRWGKYAGHVFIYVLNDLPRLAERYGLTRLS